MKVRKNPCRNRCKDENLTDHYRYIGCGTPYCGGGHESHCRRCGFYSTDCPCGASSGFDTISCAQRAAIRKRKAKGH